MTEPKLCRMLMKAVRRSDDDNSSTQSFIDMVKSTLHVISFSVAAMNSSVLEPSPRQSDSEAVGSQMLCSSPLAVRGVIEVKETSLSIWSRRCHGDELTNM